MDDLIVRRPHNTSEIQADFIGKGITDGIKREIDIKAIEGTGIQDFQTQTENIIDGIKDDLQKSKDPLNFIPICDLLQAPNFFKPDIYEDIKNGLEPNQFNQTRFLFD